VFLSRIRTKRLLFRLVSALQKLLVTSEFDLKWALSSIDLLDQALIKVPCYRFDINHFKPLVLLETLNYSVNCSIVKLVEVAYGEVLEDWVSLDHTTQGMDD
jgi:hypothetical protein